MPLQFSTFVIIHLMVTGPSKYKQGKSQEFGFFGGSIRTNIITFNNNNNNNNFLSHDNSGNKIQDFSFVMLQN